MELMVLSEETKERAVLRALEVLRRGGIVVGPTDTVYGIFCDAANPEAIRKVFKIKKRLAEKALPIFVKDVVTSRSFACIDDRKTRFLEKVWPGPVTVVFHHKEKLPRVLTGGKETIGIRIPNHPFLLDLLVRLDIPLAQTSANLSGAPPIRSAGEALAQWKKEKLINLVIDGGEMPVKPSTVIDFTAHSPVVLRSGILTKEELDRLLEWR